MNSRGFSQNKEKGGCFMGQHEYDPTRVSGAGFLGRGEQGSAQTHEWGYIFSPAPLGPSLADATHVNKYLTIKYPLIMSQADLWNEKEAKKDAGIAMPALLLHSQSQPRVSLITCVDLGFLLPPCLLHTHLSLQKASRCCCAGSPCLSRKTEK